MFFWKKECPSPFKEAMSLVSLAPFLLGRDWKGLFICKTKLVLLSRLNKIVES